MTLFPPEYFQRQDNSDDRYFYNMPRKVVHIDAEAIAALSQIFGQLLPPGGTYLDLMSSWRTHLPDTLLSAHVTGLGMNRDEMADNPQLNEIVVHNLNQTPALPFDDEQFDAVMCTVSVQYLTRPIEIFTEVNRVLKSNAPFIISFSNRCFPSKAVAVWRGTDDEQHISLVSHYLAESSGWSDVEARYKPGHDDVDPLYVLWAYKK
ncbi:MAG: methyltransferase domain-containing protein [Anaerolineae bacterium]|nr:methyltransferase domain-containing protein [Anaerolineae bacterium]